MNHSFAYSSTDQQRFGDYSDELQHQETALSDWDADPCTGNIEATARRPTIDQNFPLSTIGATATTKRGITCGPVDANLSTNTDTNTNTFKKTSPFAFVPTPSIDLQGMLSICVASLTVGYKTLLRLTV